MQTAADILYAKTIPMDVPMCRSIGIYFVIGSIGVCKSHACHRRGT